MRQEPSEERLWRSKSRELKDNLPRPWLIRTYRDLFLNVGCALQAEEVFRGSKDGVPLEVLITLFTRQPEGATIAE